MRYMLLLAIVLTCLAATVRIDGVWPPVELREQLKVSVERVIQPGRALLTTVSRQFPSLASSPHAAERAHPDMNLPLPRAFAGGVVPSAQEEPTCS